MRPKNRLVENISSETGARLFYMVTRFFIPPFVLGRIGLEGYGLYGAVFMLVAYFGMSSIGFSNAYVKYVASYSASGETDRANRLLSSGFTLMTIAALVLFALFVPAWPWVAGWMKVPAYLDSDAQILSLTIVGTFLAYLALSVFRDALAGLQEISLVQKVWVVTVVVETALIFGLVEMNLGLRGLGLAFLVRTGLEVALNRYFALRRVPWLRIHLVRPDRESLRLLLNFGGVVQFNSMLAIFLSSIERFIASPILGLEAAGVFDLGKRLPGMASSIPGAFAASLLPAAAHVHTVVGEASRRSELRRIYLSSTRYMNAISGTLFAFLATCAGPCLLFWLGKVPPQATVLMAMFSISTQLHQLTGTGTSLLKAAGRPQMEFHYSVTNVVTLRLLVPASRMLAGEWDILGIAWAVVVSTAFSALWFLVKAHGVLGIAAKDIFQRVALPGLLPWLAAAVTSLPLSHLVPIHSRWQALGLMAAAAGMYALAVAVLMLFAADNEERRLVRQLMPIRLRQAAPEAA